MRTPLVLAAALLAGCTQPKPPPRPAYRPITSKPEPLETVVARVNANADRMPAGVQLSASVVVEGGFFDEDGKEHRLDGRGSLTFRKPNDLYVRIKHDLGGVVAEIGSNRERFWLSLYQDKVIRWGRHANLRRTDVRKDLSIRPDQLIAALGLTRLPTPSDGYIGPSYIASGGAAPHTLDPQCVLQYLWPLGDGRVRIDREYSISRVEPFLTTRIVSKDSLGQNSWEATLADLRAVGIEDKVIEPPAPILPHRIHLRLSKEDRFLGLELANARIMPVTSRIRQKGWPDLDPKAVPKDWQCIQVDAKYQETKTTRPSSKPSTTGPAS